MSVRSVALAALVAAVEVASQDVVVDIPSTLSPRPLVPDVYGYSIEPIWVNDYVSTPFANTLLSAIKDVTGKPPGIRVGGNTADQTYFHPTLSTGNASVAIPDLLTTKIFNITPSWYDGWANYFPSDTELIYTLNLGVNTSNWANAVAEASAAYTALGSKLTLFELGNEIDHFIKKSWRDPSWNVATYLEQFRNLSGQIVGSEWYKSAKAPPKFQSGVFADPPWVPDQQDEIDDFSIENLTLAETAADREVVGTYATHLYPQSTCDGPRWLRMRLDLLSNHTTLWLNVSQYAPQAAAAEAAGSHLVMGETNSVSCGGKSGISDTFGAALWGADYVLTGATIGIRKTYFHLGGQSEYSAFTPKGYVLKNETLGAGIRANWYGHYFIAKVVAAARGEELSVAALPGANSSDLSGFAVYSGSGAKNATKGELKKLVFLDMGVWNGTQGLANNSTLKATDGTFFSQGARPNATITVATPWAAGSKVGVTRLTGPGTNAKSGVAVSGVTFDARTGKKVGQEVVETLQVGQNGALVISVRRAEGVLLEIGGASNGTSGSGSGGHTSPEISGASGKGMMAWTALLMGADEKSKK
ncbi:glycoside hydrolase superfamily [Annulohypoxylon maeteangense]|uniref:glycoside hydrolase superfamily n=1 Tax=Annulohypoxylon maeteangense TaxID=1927788 RepID=UPI002007A39B|nr:glycoside hydrolase superfamily [Annulohypoxylon maeteangense]KAI0887996.1 glycoside hydrolase superfamily [Annulohypoxylon maeteangense]